MKKYKKILIIISIIITILVVGFIAVILIDRKEQKKRIDKDEAEYGNNYQKLNQVMSSYNQEPDRIIYKPKEKDYFYVIDKNDEEYKHLLEVVEDRMVYSYWENTSDFKVDSIDRIMSSGKNYIILDYNKEKYENIIEDNGTTPAPIVYKLKDENRCKRLISYITQFRKRYSLEELEKLIDKKGFDRNSLSVEGNENSSLIQEGYKLIYTQEDLRNLGYNIAGKYCLANDINFNGEAFCFQNNFTGELNGNGHSIKNIKITTDKMSNLTSFALFAENMGTIKNLNIENIVIDVENVDYYPTGVITRKNSGTIENCTVSGNIRVSSENANAYGICGNLNSGIIKNCINKAKIEVINGMANGICGYSSGGRIESCVNEGEIIADSATGICLDYVGELKDCTNKGKIATKNVASGIVMYNKGTMENCNNEGDISSENSLVSGISTFNNGEIRNCKNTGNLTGTNIVGGITNSNGDPNEIFGKIIDCYSSGTLTINESEQYYTSNMYVGGIAANHILGEIKNSKFEGNIIINSKNNVSKGNIAGEKSTRAIIDTNDSYGKEYDFQKYYEENWSATYND